MTSQIKSISKNKVTDRTTFDANLFLFNDLHQFWVESKMETVTDSLSSEEDSIIKLSMVFVVSLTTMKIQWEIFAHSFSFVDSFNYLRHELI